MTRAGADSGRRAGSIGRLIDLRTPDARAPARRDRLWREPRAAIVLSWVVSCSLLTSCAEDPPDPNDLPEWRAVFERLPSALLRVFGRDARDVYAIGADAEGTGPLILHFDGTAWKALESGVHGDLWWGTFLGRDLVRMVGESGLILDYVPSTGKFRTLSSGTDHTLFGVWGESQADVWYVGGLASLGTGIVLRSQGDDVRLFDPQPVATSSATLFKVHGFASDDVFMVGQRGSVLHFDGTAIEPMEAGPKLPLIAVHGVDPTGVYAAGGGATGALLRYDGAVWHDETPPETPMMSGIHAVDRDRAFAVGFNGRVFERRGGAWGEATETIPTFEDLHGAWVDETGAVWAVGGRLTTDPPTNGVLVRLGHSIPSTISK